MNSKNLGNHYQRSVYIRERSFVLTDRKIGCAGHFEAPKDEAPCQLLLGLSPTSPPNASNLDLCEDELQNATGGAPSNGELSLIPPLILVRC